jgi:hypothetical protein
VAVSVPTTTGSAANRLDCVDADRLERWIFFAYLVCHNVVDVADKDSGEYRHGYCSTVFLQCINDLFVRQDLDADAAGNVDRLHYKVSGDQQSTGNIEKDLI